MTRYERNFRKTFELIQTCFDLKEAYLRARHPNMTAEQTKRLIYRQILHRKQRQWKSPEK